MTVYRSSAAIENMRFHVASFDADEGFDYNWENCWIAAKLFEGQLGVTVKY